MQNRLHAVVALVVLAALSAGCSQGGGTPSEPIFATASPVIATALASPSPLATTAPTTSPSPLATPSLTGNGEFIFSAPSTSDIPEPGPYVLTGVGGQYQGADFNVTERFYDGVPALTACRSTDPTATCTTTDAYDATCKNASATLTINPFHTYFLAGYDNPTQALLTCVFTFGDPYGHSTDLTVTTDPSVAEGTPTPEPAATGDGNFSFNPPSPYAAPSGSAYVFPSEGNYHGQFKVTGCAVGTASCIDLGTPNVGEYACNDTQLGSTGRRSLTDFFNASATGTSAQACTFIVTDEFGHSAPYTVTGSATAVTNAIRTRR